jgi:hypothetical protein
MNLLSIEEYLLHAFATLQHLLNVLVQIANKTGIKKSLCPVNSQGQLQ